MNAADTIPAPPSLRAKTTRPPCPDDLVARRRLVDRLNAGLDRRLTLITAPAGYGKTTAAVQWVCAVDRPCAWLSLDPLDDDLPTFVAYLLAAIRHAYPGAAVHTGALLNIQAVPPAVLADALIEDLADLPGPLLLVLDDYYVLADDAIAAFMERLVQFLSANVHLALVSRVDPPLPLARLRGRRELAEIRLDQLQFSRDETRQLLADLLGAEVDDGAAALLEARTEGWAIGLRLAAITKGPGETVSDLAARLGDGVFADAADYLLAEVLALQPPDVQVFLLRSAILERLSDDLCRAVAGLPDDGAAAPTLHELSRANLLITALDDQHRWFRFHALFRDLLRRRLHEVAPRESIARLHRRASAWFAAEGMVSDAVSHALAAGDEDAAARIVEAQTNDALDREVHSTLAHWLDLLPETARRRPALLLARAWLLNIQFRMAALPHITAELDRQLAQDVSLPADRRVAFQQQSNLLKAIAAYWSGNAAAALALVEEALPHLRHAGLYVRGIVSFYYAAALHGCGRSSEALAYLRGALDEPDLQSDTSHSRLLLSTALIYLQQADMTGLQSVGRALSHLGARSDLPLTTYWAHYILGLVHYEWNELPQAEQDLRQVVRARFEANGRTASDAYVALALTLEARGRPAEADEALDQMREFLVETGAAAVLDVVQATRQQVRVSRGEATPRPRPDAPLSPAAARAELHRSFLLSPSLTRARCLLQQATPEAQAEARALLAGTRQAAEELGHLWRLAETLALEACLAAATGDEDAALERLGRALEIGAPGRLVRTFLSCGPGLVPLLQKLQARGRQTAYIRLLLNAFAETAAATRVAARSAETAGDDEAWIRLRSSLTNREMDVLALLDQRLSNQEIAAQLFVEPETVKKHLQNIYRKLGVDNRREAAALAERVGLFRRA